MVVVSFSPFPGDPRPRRAAETFLQAGMDVEIICRREEGERGRDVFNGMKIDRVAIKHERGSKLGYLLRYVLFIGIAFAKLSGRSFMRGYDIVHIHNMPDVLVLAAVVPKLLGAKVILDLHDPMPELMMTIFGLRKESRAVAAMALLEKWSIALADRVLTVNRACEKIFIARSCSPEKVTVIMNAPDEGMFRFVPTNSKEPRSAKTSAPFIIMYHGTLVERNGVDLAVEALAKVRDTVPTAELHIYGPRTPFLDRVLNMVTEKRLEKAVRYLGRGA
jgi:glycosyltransferase involved in cell wall biosynthesis